MALASLLVQTLDAAPQADWASWRGPTGTGLARFEKPPTQWSETQNIKWKVAVPGLGLSTPIVWRDRIYLTTAVATKRAGTADVDEPEHRLALPRPKIYYKFDVLALDRATGKTVWRKNVAEAVPHEGGHRTNSHASISPITDGSFLYCNFGSRGLFCLDLDGELRWKKNLGRMRTRRQYGEASSPALWGKSLIINWDHEGDSFLVVLDKRNGEEIWRKARDEITSWSTPIVVRVDGRPQIIVSATGASRGYDLETGDIVWHVSGMTVNCIPTPIYRDGLVYLMSGYRGRALQAVLLAGAKGDLAESEHLRWSYGQRVSYVPSALLYDDHFYFVRGNTGVLNCLDAITGTAHFEGRKLAGIRSVYASPVGANGHVYITSRDGVTRVLKHGKPFADVATNVLDDKVDASLAIAGNEIYLRGRKHMYCIAHDAIVTPIKKAAKAPERATPKETPALAYQPAAQVGAPKDLTAGLTSADLDGDGDLDLVAANGRHWRGQNMLYLGDGNGGFTARKLGAPSKSYRAALGDLDGDGDVDIVVANDREPSRIYWNDGAAGFGAGAVVGEVTSSRSVMLADLDGKHGLDIVFSNRGAANTICYNDGARGFARVVHFGGAQASTIWETSTWSSRTGAASRTRSTSATRPGASRRPCPTVPARTRPEASSSSTRMATIASTSSTRISASRT